MNKIIKNAVVNSLGTALYIIIVASFFSNASRIFGSDGKPDNTFLTPIVMLLLLVLSAAITGSLVFGRPILWYLDGQKKDAISLLLHTLGYLFVLTLLAMSVLYILK